MDEEKKENEEINSNSDDILDNQKQEDKQEKEEEENPICEICCEDLYSEEVLKLKCSHIFHKECIEQCFLSLSTQRGTTDKICPYCIIP